MSKAPPPDDDPATDLESLDEWLAETAEMRGVSKHELLNDLLSSYWIMDELAEMVDEANAAGNLGPDVDPEKRESGGDATRDRERPVDEKSERGPNASSDATSGDRAAGDALSADLSRQLADLQETLRAFTDLQQASEGSAPDLPPGSDEPQPKRSDDQPTPVTPEEPSDRIDAVVERLDSLRQRQDRLADEIASDLQRLQARIEALPDGAATVGQLEALSDELDADLRSLRTEQDRLETYIEREFDAIEDGFRHLLDVVEEVETRLETFAESYEANLEALTNYRAERERLAALREEALSRGVRQGVCTNCDRKVDLAMLDAAQCPECARSFSGITDGGWNPFRSPRLRAEPRDDSDRSTASSVPDPPEGRSE